MLSSPIYPKVYVGSIMNICPVVCLAIEAKGNTCCSKELFEACGDSV